MSAAREFLLDLVERFAPFMPEVRPHVYIQISREVAYELLADEAERDAAEFSFDAATRTVSIFGTRFASDVLQNFRTSSHEDECYQHVRQADGAVMTTRTYGHRAQMRALRSMLESRPRVADQQQLDAFNRKVEQLLAFPVNTLQNEAYAIDNLVQRAREFGDAVQRLSVEASDEAREAQLSAYGVLSEAIAQVDRAREFLFTADVLASPASEGPAS